ncbi:MAG: hypothetical protein LBD04_12915 [Synergistaceae bacterium]|jgi:hypothetical protein|nr:hypothetical protein [Synergistaceae bacterium]
MYFVLYGAMLSARARYTHQLFFYGAAALIQTAAFNNRNPEAVSLLLKYGADARVKDKKRQKGNRLCQEQSKV